MLIKESPNRAEPCTSLQNSDWTKAGSLASHGSQSNKQKAPGFQDKEPGSDFSAPWGCESWGKTESKLPGSKLCSLTRWQGLSVNSALNVQQQKAQKTVKLVADNVPREPGVLCLPEVIRHLHEKFGLWNGLQSEFSRAFGRLNMFPVRWCWG